MRIKVVQLNIENKDLNNGFDLICSHLDNDSDLIVFPIGAIGGIGALFEINSSQYLSECYTICQKIASKAENKVLIWGSLNNIGQLSAYVAFDQKIQAIIPLYENNFSNNLIYSEGFKFSVCQKNFIVGNYDNCVSDCVSICLGKEIYRHQKLVTDNKADIYVNPVGLVDDGHHFVYFSGGSKLFNNQLSFLDSGYVYDNDILNNNIKVPSLLEFLLFVIKRIDNQYFSFAKKWVIGLSGGLDSSVVAALLTLSLGKERVLGLNMASDYNSLTTKNNANSLATKLGIEIYNGSIMDLVAATDLTLNKYNFESSTGLARENVQARLRGHLLMTVASLVGGVVSNNTNKIESFLGYGTMYGDIIGALGFLNDLTKQEVWRLGLEINKYLNAEIIPSSLLPVENDKGLVWEFMPSAELSYDQVDPMKWGYHDYLISNLMTNMDYLYEFMSGYLADKLSSSPVGCYISAYGLDDAAYFINDLEWVLSTMNRNNFKRLVFCPFIVCGGSGSFGIEYIDTLSKYVYSNKYKQLKEAILNV